jgi:hypothetical protein
MRFGFDPSDPFELKVPGKDTMQYNREREWTSAPITVKLDFFFSLKQTFSASSDSPRRADRDIVLPINQGHYEKSASQKRCRIGCRGKKMQVFSGKSKLKENFCCLF